MTMLLLMLSHPTAGHHHAWSIVGQRGWLEVSMQTPGVQPYFLEHQHPQCSLLCSLQLAVKMAAKGGRSSQSVLGRGQHSISGSADHRGPGTQVAGQRNERAEGTREEVRSGAGRPHERAPCARLLARADLCYPHRSPRWSQLRQAYAGRRPSNRAKDQAGAGRELPEAKQGLVVTGPGRRGRCGEERRPQSGFQA